MVNITTGALPSGTATTADQFVGNQGGVTKRLTVEMDSIGGYESSTVWTPTLYGATTAGTTTYDYQEGIYFKVGGLALLTFRIGWSNATGTGEARIGGFPFTATSLPSTMRYPISFSYYNGLSLPSGKRLAGYIQDGTNYARLLNGDNTTFNDPTDLQSELTVGGEIYGNIFYIVG
jgi:hypothetical protein